MSKPNEFRETYVLAADVPYQAAGKVSGDSQAGQGTLRQGRVVWLQDEPGYDSGISVKAYAEGVGLIQVTPDSLVRVSSI